MIKCVIDAKNFVLKLGPFGKKKEPWEIVCLSDNNYARDPISRRSVSGFMLYVLSVPVSWQLKVKRSIILLSPEAE